MNDKPNREQWLSEIQERIQEVLIEFDIESRAYTLPTKDIIMIDLTMRGELE